MNYDFREHKHNYSIWTAARAVQRSFTTTLNIRLAIDQTDIRSFAESEIKVDQDQFDLLHKKWCQNMIDIFEALGVKAAYGRVSKLIAIYLKTSVVISSEPDAPYLQFIHPPIDRTILKNLPVEMREFKKLVWTQLTEDEYWHMVFCFRERLKFFDWRLEILWRPEQADD